MKKVTITFGYDHQMNPITKYIFKNGHNSIIYDVIENEPD